MSRWNSWCNVSYKILEINRRIHTLCEGDLLELTDAFKIDDAHTARATRLDTR